MTSSSNTAELEACLATLKRLCDSPELCLTPNSQHQEILKQVGLLSKRVKAARKRAEKVRDQNLVEQSEIRNQRHNKSNGRFLATGTESSPDVGPVDSGESVPFQSPTKLLAQERSCYICKQKYSTLDAFYDCLCPSCARENFEKRSQTGDLRGKTVLLTGGRIKIGFQAALMLLRSGAEVFVTSRFPADTLQRYTQETDHEDWLQRLTIFSADFRFLPTVDAMCAEIKQRVSKLDILINNAAQTVRRPPEYYRHLLGKESLLRTELGHAALARLASPDSALANYHQREKGLSSQATEDMHVATLLSQAKLLPTDGRHSRTEFPPEQYDVDGQQIDQRKANSWIAELGDIELPELLEVHAVNALIPFLLIQRFSPLLEASGHPSFVINVSAMEGHFAKGSKTGFHPHTNMAKAAMNMITRTSAERFAKRKIFMNSVDTGWVTNEYPFGKVQAMQEAGFEPPLDEIDGAARVLDPIFVALNQGEFSFGNFFKDYKPAPW